MKKLTIFILIIVPFFALSQNFKDILKFSSDSSSKDKMVIINGDGFISSNSMETDIIRKFIWGGTISNELKKSTISNLTNSNIIGAQANGGVSFISSLSGRFSKGLSLILSYQQHTFNELKLNKEIPDIILNGNTNYLGKSISLKNTEINSLNYSTLSIGLLKTAENRNRKYTFGMTLGYAIGLSNTRLKISSGQMQFAPDGSSIKLNSIYQIAYTDTAKSRILNGNGGVASLFYEYAIKNKYSISCSIENFGFIRWNPNSFSTQKNVVKEFEGFGIDDIAHIDNNMIEHSKDSIINSLYYPDSTSSYTTKLPCTISINGSYQFSKHFSITASIWKQINTVQNFGYILKPIYSIPFMPTEIAPYVCSNGYSNMDLGLELIFKNIKNIIIKTDIYSLQITKKTIGGAFAIAYKF